MSTVLSRLSWTHTRNSPLTVMLIDGLNMPNFGSLKKRACAPLQEFVDQADEALGETIEVMTSNHEGKILDAIHEFAPKVDAYILNPAGLTKTGKLSRHALEETEKPWAEVHFSTISAPSWSGRGLPGGTQDSNFTRFETGMPPGLRHHSDSGALMGLVSVLGDTDFLDKHAAGALAAGAYHAV
jgi:3-dehydroquinate dehydratase-2